MTFRLVMKQVALEQGVQATFMPKPFSEYPGSGMHTHLSLFERPQRLLRVGRRVPALQGRPLLHRGPPQARRGDGGGHQPVGQLLQAHLGRLLPHGRLRRRGPFVHLLGPQQPLGADPSPDVQAGQDGFLPGRGPLDRLGRNRTSPTRSSSRRASRASRRATNSRRAPTTTSGPSPTPNAAPWASNPSRRTSARPSP